MLLQCLKLIWHKLSVSSTSLLKIISCLRYLAHEGLPFRRHGDERGANFKQSIRFRTEDDPAFAKQLKEKNLSYTSAEIQKEMLKHIVVVKCTKKSDFFSIMVDKSSDVSNREQVVFCVYWVDEDLHSHEDFIGLYEMEKTDAATMVKGLDNAKLHGQCYDGCSTMTGKKKGVATLIKQDVQTLALSIHFYAHSLNCACGDWIKNSTVVSDSLDTSYEIAKSSFLQSAIHAFGKFTRRSIRKTKKSLVVRCKP